MTSHFSQLAAGFDVAPALAELDAQPHLWNSNPERRTGQSPHRETDDLWLRYRSRAELLGPDDAVWPHRSVWYPAWHALPGLHAIAREIRYLVNPIRFGGVLMTRIPPGGTVYPHHDRGTWHAEYYRTKVWLPLRANDACINHVESESMVWKPGDAWMHDNLKVHAVENRGATERICLILCFRRACD